LLWAFSIGVLIQLRNALWEIGVVAKEEITPCTVSAWVVLERLTGLGRGVVGLRRDAESL